MDELDFEYLNTFPDVYPGRKALVFIKSGISTFAKERLYKLPREQVETIICRHVFICYNRIKIYTC